MKNGQDKPDIFSYQKSHVYLADLFTWFKTKKISLRNLALKLNVSPALLSLIAKGKRQMTEENVDVWAPVMKWNDQEVSYLKQLIIFEFSSPKNKKAALENLTKFKSYQENSSQEVLTFKYLKKWWNLAIREMSSLPDFEEDEAWIQRRLLYTVSLTDIRKSLTFLNKHRLLAKYGEFRRLDCQGNVYKLSLSDFHKQILEKAVESIYKVSSDERHILGHTMVLSKDKLPELKSILDETLEKITKLSDENLTDAEIFHVSLLGFPLTENKEST